MSGFIGKFTGDGGQTYGFDISERPVGLHDELTVGRHHC